MVVTKEHRRTLQGFNYSAVYQVDATLNPFRVLIPIWFTDPAFHAGLFTFDPFRVERETFDIFVINK